MKRYWVKEFKSQMEDKNSVLIDIRTPGEIRYWKIKKDCLVLDFYGPNFVNEILKLDKSKKYLIYCAYGNRSFSLLNFMTAQWFSDIADLEWWIADWMDSWEKIEK